MYFLAYIKNILFHYLYFINYFDSGKKKSIIKDIRNELIDSKRNLYKSSNYNYIKIVLMEIASLIMY